MTHSHKVLVLVPPFLIGFTILLTLFTMRHNAMMNQVDENPLENPKEFEVTTPVPGLQQREAPIPAPGEELPEDSDLIACTMDAKVCPDGSMVGRTGPDCEFRPCGEQVLKEIENI